LGGNVLCRNTSKQVIFSSHLLLKLLHLLLQRLYLRLLLPQVLLLLLQTLLLLLQLRFHLPCILAQAAGVLKHSCALAAVLAMPQHLFPNRGCRRTILHMT
jgi:hypothetical protein